jgi:hypothetical protein
LQRRRSKTSCVQPGLAHPNWKTPDIRIPERRSRPRSGRDSPLGLAHLCRTQRVLPTPQRIAGQTDESTETMLGELCGAKNSAGEEEETGAAGARRLPPRRSPWLPSLATPPNPPRSAATRRTTAGERRAHMLSNTPNAAGASTTPHILTDGVSTCPPTEGQRHGKHLALHCRACSPAQLPRPLFLRGHARHHAPATSVADHAFSVGRLLQLCCST